MKRRSFLHRVEAAVVITAYLSQLAVAGGIDGGDPPPHGGDYPRYPEGTIQPARAPIALPGGGGVGDGGGATYDLPLRVPAGPHGMEPSLAITYGGRGNGPLGVGFALAGTSIITPCGKSIASEGYADGVDWGIGELQEAGLTDSSGDSYCLDGQKLVPHGDPDFIPPLDGYTAQYHTEIESFVHVLARRESNQSVQPDYFTVLLRDGTVRTYEPIFGHVLVGAEDAKSKLQPAKETIAVAYVLVSSVDANGNQIRYTYDDDDAMADGSEVAWRLERIDYGWGAQATARRRVELRYEWRPDPIVRYVHGVKFVTRSRLVGVDMYAPNPVSVEKVWRYDLDYTESAETGRSLLAAVKTCDAFDSCSWTRSFRYTQRDHGPLDFHVMAGDAEFGALANGYDATTLQHYHDDATRNWLRPNDARLLLYDMDGDGDDDALYRTALSWVFGFNDTVCTDSGYCALAAHDYLRIPGEIKVRLSSEDQPLDLMVYDVSQILEPHWYPASWGSDDDEGRVGSYARLGSSRVADFNSDGYPDLMVAQTRITKSGQVPDPENDPAQVYTREDTWEWGFQTYFGRQFDHFSEHVYEAQGDELDETIIHGPVQRWAFDTPYPDYLLTVAKPPFQRIIADLDGDAKPEVIDAVDGNIDSMDPPDVDWNDPYSYNDSGFFYYHTELSSDGAPAMFGQKWTCGNGNAITGDFDGDGRQDVFVTADPIEDEALGDPIEGSQTYKRLVLTDPWAGSTVHGMPEEGYTSKLWGGGCGGDMPDLVVGDWNGDGLDDVLYPPDSYGNNAHPLVRWNIGGGFGPAEEIQVTGAAGIEALMEQEVPVGKLGQQVDWDRGTRVADVDGDGRADIVAFRQDNAACVDPIIDGDPDDADFGCENKLVVFRSQGDHFTGEVLLTWQDGGANLTQGFSLSQVGDVDGDGNTDAVYVAGGRMHVVELPWHEQPDLLRQVKDDGSAYALETFTYDRRWWGDKPRAEATNDSPTGPAACAWPITCPRRGSLVVREHLVFAGTRDDGSPMWATTRHKFANPRVSLLGRGALGFESHDIWRVETGTGTHRTFDNYSAIDPVGPSMGGIFYPGVGRLRGETSITPLAPMPTEAQLAVYGNVAPGLVDSQIVDVRSSGSTTYDELRSSPGGRIVTILPQATTATDAEGQAAPWISNGTPEWTHYIGGAGSKTSSRTEFDAYGNPTEIETEIGQANGVGAAFATRTKRTTYENRVDRWQLGLPTRTVDRAYDHDDVDRPGRVTRWTYDDLGNVASLEVNALEADLMCPYPTDIHDCEHKSTITTYTHDGYGNVTTATATAFDVAEPRTTTTTWEPDGVYPLSVTDAAGFTTSAMLHPALGVPIVTSDANGVTSTSIFDGFGRMLAAYRPGAASVNRTYSEVTDGNRRGIRTEIEHGDGGRSFSITDEAGRIIHSGVRGFDSIWSYGHDRYDSAGNIMGSARPEVTPTPVKWSSTTYDRLGQALASTALDGATTVHAPSIFETTTWDPEGHESYQLRDLLGRVIESGHRLGGNDAYGEVTFTFGAFDQIERTADAGGNKTELRYDGFGRLVREDNPDTGTTKATYDGFSQKVKETRANGDVMTTTYDVLGRRTSTTGPDGTTTMTYDVGPGAARQLSQAVSPDGVTTRIMYDGLGRVRLLKQVDDVHALEMVNRYDGFGRLAFQLYPEVPGFDRFTVAYSYGADGQLRAVGDASACQVSPDPSVPVPPCTAPVLWQVLKRNARDQLTKAKLGNNVTANRAYDADTGQLTSVAAAGVTTAYTYDEDGLVHTRFDPDTNRTDEFAYDDLHRLTGWDFTGPKKKSGAASAAMERAYEYDEVGNLVKVLDDASNTVFSGAYGGAGGPHTLASSSVGAYAYDQLGRQTSGGGRTIEWTQRDQPRSITTAAGTRLFTYDANGGRVSREDAQGKVAYLGRHYEHRDTIAIGQMDTFYVYAEAGVVAQVDYAATGKTTRYVVDDPLGSPAIITKATGVVEERGYFDPWGARIDADGNPIADPAPSTSMGFTGHEDDGDGLVNMQGRIYDRAQYRFLSPDALIPSPLFGQSHNPYLYVFDNPVNFVDPTGFDPDPSNPCPNERTTIDFHQEKTPLGGTMIISDTSVVICVDKPSTPPPPKKTEARPVIPNVEKKKPWGLSTPALDIVKMGARIFSDGRATWGQRALGAVGVITHASNAIDEMTMNMIIALPQAPVLSFKAADEHRARGVRLEAWGADSAADDEYLAAAQEGFLGIGETASLATIYVPKPNVVAAEAAEVRLLAEATEVTELAVASEKAAGIPLDLFNGAKQWSSTANANAYRSTTEQYLYVVLDKHGATLKYGTTRDIPSRYGSKLEELFGEGATIEEMAHGNTRTMRYSERELIRRYEWLNGTRPPFNKTYH
jgi:RHS repeat-associated protein